MSACLNCEEDSIMRTGAKRTLTTVAMMFTLAFAGIAKAETGVTDKEIVIGTANALSGQVHSRVANSMSVLILTSNASMQRAA